MKLRQKGESYRPIATVLKTKKGVPTVLRISGNTYILDHPDKYKGARKHDRSRKD